MNYITVTTEVEAEIDIIRDIDDEDVLEIVSTRLRHYANRTDKKDYEDLVSDLLDTIKASKLHCSEPEEENVIKAETFDDVLKIRVCKELMQKCTLEKLESILNNL